MADGFEISRRGLLAGIGGGTLAAALPARAQEHLLAQAPAAPVVREITQIAGNLYRFRNNGHYSVFLVTPAGIIATDPINAAAATWLKAEFKSRFNQVARYVVLSHDHADHSSGGEVFADTAVIVAQENARAVILGEHRPTALPGITFSDRMTIELGGGVADLRYVGRNHSDNSMVMVFPAERTLFAVDFIPVESLAFRTLPDSYFPDWLASLKEVETMDFDILAPGHGKLGRKEHVAAFRGYLEELHREVLKAARAGQTLAEMQASIRLERYAGWEGYADIRPLNIEGMYRIVQGNRRDNAGGSGKAPI